jgi:hypothetical protein
MSQPSQAEVDQCASRRIEPFAALYKLRLVNRMATPLPLKQSLFGPCEIYEAGLSSRLAANGTYRIALNALLSGVSRELATTGGERFRFGDWESFVVENLRAALEPSSNLKLADRADVTLLNELDRYVSEVKQASGYAQLSKNYRDEFGNWILNLASQSRGVPAEAAMLRRASVAAVKIGEAYVQPFAQMIRRATIAGYVESALTWIEAAPE